MLQIYVLFGCMPRPWVTAGSIPAAKELSLYSDICTVRLASHDGVKIWFHRVAKRSTFVQQHTNFSASLLNDVAWVRVLGDH